MMKEKAIPKKVKGTVLFTVVSVMMVLIVFLMGTMALAATASNRSYRNYQKEQTEATARAVLESVLEAVDRDPGNIGGLKAQIGALAMGGSFDVTVTSDDGVDAIVTITKIDTTSVYDTAREEWKTGGVYEVATEIEMQSTGTKTVYKAMMTDISVTVTNTNTNSSGGAFVSLGDIDSGIIGTHGFVAGGTEIGVGVPGGVNVTLDNGSIQMAPFYLNGNLDLKSQTGMYFDRVGSGMYVAITGNFTPVNNFGEAQHSGFLVSDNFKWPSGAVDYKFVPTLYVGGTINMGSNNVYFAPDGDMPMNVYCGSIVKGDYNAFKLTGNLCLFDENATNELTNINSNGSALYQWAKKSIMYADGSTRDTVFGDLYSLGKVNLGMDIQGNVSVDNDLTITRNTNVGFGGEGGDVICGGTLTINSGVTLNCKNVYAANIINNGNINCTGSIHAFEATGVDLTAGSNSQYTGGGSIIGYKTVTYTMKNTDGFVDGIRINDPGSGNSGSFDYEYTIETNNNGVVTTQTISGTEQIWWFDRNYWVDLQGYLNGDQNQIYKDVRTAAATPVVSEPIYEYDLEGEIGKKIYPDEYTKDRVYNDIVGGEPQPTSYDFPDTEAELSATLTVSNTPINLNGTGAGTEADPYVISTPGLLNSQTANVGNDKWVYINPTGPMVIVVDGFSVEGWHIIINDTSPVYFFIKGSGMTISNTQMITKDYYDLFNSGATSVTIDMVQPDAQSPYYPNVFVYGDENGSKFVINNTRSFVTANFNAQHLDFENHTCGPLGIEVKYRSPANFDTNGDNVINQLDQSEYTFAASDPVNIIGQLICNKITADAGGFGLIYVTIDQLPTCGCGCPTCNGDPTTCTCGGTCCASCNCGGGGGGGGGSSIPEKLYNMYYNFY